MLKGNHYEINTVVFDLILKFICSLSIPLIIYCSATYVNLIVWSNPSTAHNVIDVSMSLITTANG